MQPQSREAQAQQEKQSTTDNTDKKDQKRNARFKRKNSICFCFYISAVIRNSWSRFSPLRIIEPESKVCES
jgi:hypothetical protein